MMDEGGRRKYEVRGFKIRPASTFLADLPALPLPAGRQQASIHRMRAQINADTSKSIQSVIRFRHQASDFWLQSSTS